MNDTTFGVRRGARADIPAVHALIMELATYERAPEEVLLTPGRLEEDGFGTHPRYSLWVAEKDFRVIGMALCYDRYSTWKGPVLYLEDLIVTAEERRGGVGSALMREVIRHALVGGYAGLVWQVLDWNESALQFYRAFGAESTGEWLTCRLTPEAMRAAISA